VPAKPENGPAWGKARERTAWQYDELVRRPGLRVDRFVDLDSSMKLIEASVAGIEGAQ
jgi:hypothetical protein